MVQLNNEQEKLNAQKNQLLRDQEDHKAKSALSVCLLYNLIPVCRVAQFEDIKVAFEREVVQKRAQLETKEQELKQQAANTEKIKTELEETKRSLENREHTLATSMKEFENEKQQ